MHTRVEVRARVVGPWLVVAVSAASLVYSVLLVNEWRYVVDRGVGIGGVADTPVTVAFAVLLVVLALEAATVLARERDSGLLPWLLTTPVPRSVLVGSRALASFAVLGVGLVLLALVTAGLAAVSSIPLSGDLLRVVPAFLAAGAYAVGLGLLIGALVRSTRASLTLMAAIMAVSTLVAVAGVWLASRTASEAYDGAAVVASLIDAVSVPSEYLLPLNSYLAVVGTAPNLDQAIWTHLLVALTLAAVSILLAANLLLPRGGRR